MLTLLLWKLTMISWSCPGNSDFHIWPFKSNMKNSLTWQLSFGWRWRIIEKLTRFSWSIWPVYILARKRRFVILKSGRARARVRAANMEAMKASRAVNDCILTRFSWHLTERSKKALLFPAGHSKEELCLSSYGSWMTWSRGRTATMTYFASFTRSKAFKVFYSESHSQQASSKPFQKTSLRPRVNSNAKAPKWPTVEIYVLTWLPKKQLPSVKTRS